MKKTLKKENLKDIIKFKPFDLANIFSIGFNQEKQKYEFLFNKTLYLNHDNDVVETLYDIYNPTEGDTWPLVSYKCYGTPNLWWIILKMNKITNSLKKPSEFNELKILKKDIVKDILIQIKEK